MTFEDDTPSVREGEVLRRNGQPFHLDKLISMYWGWPSKAARLATPLLRSRAGGLPVTLYIAKENRLAQQRQILFTHPEITDALLTGLSRRNTREHEQYDRDLRSITVDFAEPVHDEGVVTQIIRTLAQRFGTTTQAMAEAVEFTDDGPGALRLTTNLAEIDEIEAGHARAGKGDR